MTISISGADTNVLFRNHKAGDATGAYPTIESATYGSAAVPTTNLFNVTDGAQVLVENVGVGSSPHALYMAYSEEERRRYNRVMRDLRADSGRVTVELDDEDGRMVYEVEFDNGRMEYEYEIDAVSGKILKSDKEYDD